MHGISAKMHKSSARYQKPLKIVVDALWLDRARLISLCFKLYNICLITSEFTETQPRM